MSTTPAPKPPSIVSWRTRITDTSGTPLPTMVAVDTIDGEVIIHLGTHEYNLPRSSAEDLVRFIVNALQWDPASGSTPTKAAARRRAAGEGQ